MKSIYVEATDKPPVLKLVPIPGIDDETVLVQVKASVINPSDLLFMMGRYPANKPFPQVAGFEGSGVVIKTTEKNSDLMNRRVAFMGNGGAWAEFKKVPLCSISVIPDEYSELSFVETACTMVNPLTVVQLYQRCKARGAKAIVQTCAASQLGRMAERYFNLHGIKVINIVRKQAQVDILKNQGAEYILNSEEGKAYRKKLKKLIIELDANTLIDGVGGKLTEKIMSKMPMESKAIVYGALSNQNASISPNSLIFKRQTLEGFWLNFLNIQQEQCIEVYKNLKTFFKTDVNFQTSIDNFQDAFKIARKERNKGKVVFVF